ncbi:hypothetical protein CHU92_08985 [Flavobacterium cyanobacteriorum]|uniref:Uncharacterized protein n=2 Tax=Flavobacterium cyanobacteriorum TaxID=2022802 RepID=A0A255Z8R2_9FLAO|nr:hypothetical protein CHU92_08985 [Flavobacterium cyanobacteriorum]
MRLVFFVFIPVKSIYLLKLFTMISFNNMDFKSRVVYMPEVGEVLVSVVSLNELLMTEEGDYVNEKAQLIDEQIFYFVNDDEIDLPVKSLMSILSIGFV